MRTFVGGLAAAVLCLAVASSARAQGIQFNPFKTNGNQPQFTPFSSNGTSLKYSPFGGASAAVAPSGQQATFPPAGASLSGPRRLIDLMPHLNNLTNQRVIGFSMFPTQTDQYLSLFGFQKLR
jgi:hypothetical protein